MSAFKETEGSLPCSQKPNIWPYPKPIKSSHHWTYSLCKTHFDINSYIRLCPPTGLEALDFQQKFYVCFLFLPCVLHVYTSYLPSFNRCSSTRWKVYIVYFISVSTSSQHFFLKYRNDIFSKQLQILISFGRVGMYRAYTHPEKPGVGQGGSWAYLWTLILKAME
jgi:hypothetical protein